MFDRDKINYGKSELKNYLYLLNVCKGFEDKILSLETELEGVKSVSVRVVTGNNPKNHDIHRAELRDKLNHYQHELALIRLRTTKIQNFLDALTDEERRIITDIYINNIYIERVAVQHARSVRSLKRDIDRIMLKFD